MHSCQVYRGMPIPLHTPWDLSYAYSSLRFSSSPWIALSLLLLFLIFPNIKFHSLSHCHLHKNIPNSFIHERALQRGGPSLENLDQSFVPMRPVLVLIFSLHSHYRFAVRAPHAKGSGRKFLL